MKHNVFEKDHDKHFVSICDDIAFFLLAFIKQVNPRIIISKIIEDTKTLSLISSKRATVCKISLVFFCGSNLQNTGLLLPEKSSKGGEVYVIT